jgi:hypothetical protein
VNDVWDQSIKFDDLLSDLMNKVEENSSNSILIEKLEN